jgi:hypothetical protein
MLKEYIPFYIYRARSELGTSLDIMLKRYIYELDGDILKYLLCRNNTSNLRDVLVKFFFDKEAQIDLASVTYE